MRPINFTVKDILPSLLDKSKVQTIRPAWKEIRLKAEKFQVYPPEKTNLVYAGIPETVKNPSTNMAIVPYAAEKPPTYKVEDKVSLYWKQGSKYKWFCVFCGDNLVNNIDVGPTELHCKTHKATSCYEDRLHLAYDTKNLGVFNKLLGKVEITEVFKIEMSKVNGIMASDFPGSEDGLAKLDGFKSVNQMFKTLDGMYDLSTPKSFWVYRWKWI